MARVLFHIDLNAFYASAEVLRNSALEGQPVVVGGLAKRSVVCTASYEARKFGVRSAMPLFQALELCPQLIIVEGEHAYYEEVSKRFFQYLKTYTPCIEIASIDECYMDVTDIIKEYDRPLDLAWQIQSEVKEILKLPCSIGVGPNKFLAKMASDMRKPMGITVLRKQEVQQKLWPLPIGDMYGIGKKKAVILQELGIETIGDLLRNENYYAITKVLKNSTADLLENARGNGSDALVYNATVQSISQSTTINHDVEDYIEMCNIFKILIKKLVSRAKEDNLKGKMVSVSIRYYDFKNVVRSLNLDTYTNEERTIYEHAMLLFDQHYEGLPVRHLGVGLGSLQSQSKTMEQLNIFQTNAHKQKNVLDELNKQILGNKLVYASDLLKKKE